jgi:methionyl-tRNA formyltransferase
MRENMRIVFYGTPEFAVASLDSLLKGNDPVVAVVTAPDKPSGRGLQLKASPVKEHAVKNNIPVLQPEDLKDQSFIEELKRLKPDLQVVVAFRILPEEIWSLPPKGTFNLHSSLLPDYRGAAPINWVLINGETETGVTTFFLDKTIDTGNIILQESTPIEPSETAGELHDRLMKTGAGLVMKTTEAIRNGTVQQVSQTLLTDHEKPLHRAPKIFREMCRIDWCRNTLEVFNLVRGLSPYPGAFTEITAGGNTHMLKIFRVDPEISRPTVEPGSYLTDHRTFMKIAAYDGYLHLREIQLSGRRPMGIDQFLRGFGKVFT